MRTTPRLLVALANAALGAAALAVPAAVPGHAVAGPGASDDRYVQRLVDAGWDVENKAQIIKVAHVECAMLGHGKSTVDVVDRVVAKYRITGEAAVTQLVAAEAAFCPQHIGH